MKAPRKTPEPFKKIKDTQRSTEVKEGRGKKEEASKPLQVYKWFITFTITAWWEILFNRNTLSPHIIRIKIKVCYESYYKPRCHLMSWSKNAYDHWLHTPFAVPHKLACQGPDCHILEILTIK